MKKYEIIKKNTDFNDIINNGKYFKNKFYSIYYLKNDLSYPKFGLEISKKFGNAVERNKMTRQLRMMIDDNKNLFSNSYNYIIMVRKEIKDLSFSEMSDYFIDLLEKKGK